MPRYIALLRGINVGGNRLIKMELLRELVGAAGGTAVTSYIQSGNLVFTHAGRSAPTLAADLERRIAKSTGFDVPVVIRTAAEWGKVIAGNPFAAADVDSLHVSFVAVPPAADVLAAIEPAGFAPERFALVGRELYMHLPGGLGTSKLAIAISKVKPLATTATTRNWRTVIKLNELAAAG